MMVQNLNRKQLIKKLGIHSKTLWAIDNYWTPELNQRIMNWIGKEFIPGNNQQVFKLCREQILLIWPVFQKWLKKTGQVFNLCDMDLIILERFCNYLPKISWPRSAIQLIEMTLLEVRKFLYLKTLMSGYYLWGRNFFIEDYCFSVSLWDFQTIRNYFLKDYSEFVCFELFTLGLKKLDLHGKDIVFKDDRAYIVSGNQILLACPLIVSKNLLKLLRTRNILANDKIFSTSVNEKILKKRIYQICLEKNIPLFAPGLIQGFPKEFMRTIDEEENSLDFSYQKLTEETEDNFKPVHIKPLYDLYVEYSSKSQKIGYAWSKIDDKQFIDKQLNALRKANCKRLVIEFTGNYEALRPKLENLFDSLKYGDTLVVCKILSLALTFEEAIAKIQELIHRGISFESIFDCYGIDSDDKNNTIFSIYSSVILSDTKLKEYLIPYDKANEQFTTKRQSK